MTSKTSNRRKGQGAWSFLGLTLFAVCAVSTPALQTDAKSGPASKAFATPEQAATALVEAAEKYDVPALLEIFGADGRDLVVSEDAVEDKNRAAAFAALARAKQSIQVDPKKPSRAVLVVGDADWPFPVPMVKRSGGWVFDSKEGRTEILLRRIGANELDAIQICRGYVEAQHEYALATSQSDLSQYAQRLISTPGKRDGLAWRNEDGSWGGPCGEGVARAIEQG